MTTKNKTGWAIIILFFAALIIQVIMLSGMKIFLMVFCGFGLLILGCFLASDDEKYDEK